MRNKLIQRRTSLNPDLLESTSPALIPHARVVNSLRNIVSDRESPLQNQQRNASDVKNSKLTEHGMALTALSVSKVESKVAAIAADVNHPVIPDAEATRTTTTTAVSA